MWVLGEKLTSKTSTLTRPHTWAYLHFIHSFWNWCHLVVSEEQRTKQIRVEVKCVQFQVSGWGLRSRSVFITACSHQQETFHCPKLYVAFHLSVDTPKTGANNLEQSWHIFFVFGARQYFLSLSYFSVWALFEMASDKTEMQLLSYSIIQSPRPPSKKINNPHVPL